MPHKYRRPLEGAIPNQSRTAIGEWDSSIKILQTKSGWNVYVGRKLVASSLFFSRVVSFVGRIAA